MICQLLSVVINIEKLYKNPTTGEAQINDTTGRVKMVDVTDEESKNRRNYQRGNVINYLDGDYCITGNLWLWYHYTGQ